MSVKRMKMLTVKGVLEGLKSFDMGLCKNYVMGKQKMSQLHKGCQRTEKNIVQNGPYRC